jgi:glycosyltransferase involved in cell wall biosynthesis
MKGFLRIFDDLSDIDVVSLRSHLDGDARSVLFRGAGAVLANSGHEPFGLVGLEAMAAGGVACTGYSGEDYAVPGRNALVLQTADPREFVGLFGKIKAEPARERALRREGVLTARRYAWPEIIDKVLLPRLHFAKLPQLGVSILGAANGVV